MKSACKIKQRDLTDCGVACLASVAAYYGLYISIGTLRQYAATDRQGTNIAGLVQAAGKLEMFAKGVKGEIASLQQLPAPFIAHVIRNNLQHYVVVFKVAKNHIVYMDPTDGQFHKEKTSDFKNSWSGILILILPKDSFEKGKRESSAYAWYWQLIKPHALVLLQSIVAALIYTVLGLAPSLFIQKIVDHVIPDQNGRLLNLLTVVMVGCLCVQVIIGYIKSLFILKTGQHIDARLILGYYKHLLRLPQQFFDNMQVGEIVSRVNDAVKIRSFINNTGIDMLLNIFIIKFSFVIMVIYSWKLALLVSIVFPAYLFLFFINNYLNKKWSRRLMENAAKVETRLVESLSGIRTIKRFASEEFMEVKMQKTFIDFLKTVFTSSNYSAYVSSVSEWMLRLVTICMLCAGTYFVLRTELTVGELLSFYSLLGYFTMPAGALIAANRNLQEASIAASRLRDILDVDVERSGKTDIELSIDMMGNIVFENVHFRYGTKSPVFSGLSMEIQGGKCTAIVGESGSGKSTLLTLLQNIYAIQSGTIRIGQFNLKNISNHSLRTCISVVPQEVQLISGTIIENIAFGVYEPDMKKLLSICRLLGLDSLIEQLPHGYDSFIGEQGTGLSGGQRQRLAIARALYRDPEILLLDEATSSLDTLTELKVQEALRWFLDRGKTLIIVAHRLSTIRNCNDIKVLKLGKLIEEGSHEELMQMGGYYSEMCRESLDTVSR